MHRLRAMHITFVVKLSLSPSTCPSFLSSFPFFFYQFLSSLFYPLTLPSLSSWLCSFIGSSYPYTRGPGTGMVSRRSSPSALLSLFPRTNAVQDAAPHRRRQCSVYYNQSEESFLRFVQRNRPFFSRSNSNPKQYDADLETYMDPRLGPFYICKGEIQNCLLIRKRVRISKKSERMYL